MTDIFTPLKYLMAREAETLSGGEMQMVAIARALLGAPGLVLFDEPSQGLAPKIVDDVLGVIRRLKQEGIAAIVVEQNADVALERRRPRRRAVAGPGGLDGRGRRAHGAIPTSSGSCWGACMSAARCSRWRA